MKIRALLLPVLLIAAPVAAADKTGPASERREASVKVELEALQQALARNDGPVAIKRIERLQKLPLPAEMRQHLMMVRGMLLIVDGRRPAGLAAMAEAEDFDPSAIQPLRVKFEFGRQTGDLEVARSALISLIERDPAGVRAIDLNNVMWIVRRLRTDSRKADADALTIRMAQAGVGSADLESRHWLKSVAARALIAAGRIDEADAMMRGVGHVDVLRAALIDRRYEPLWPVLEAMVGPHMSVPAAAAIEESKLAVRDAPGSAVAIRALAQAYRHAGRLAEADRIASGFAATSEEMAKIDEKGGWLIDTHAGVLRAMGRFDDAEKRYAAMRVLDIQKSPWLISMVINRLNALVSNGRWAEAAALYDEAGRFSESHGSPYARQLVRRLKLCTVHARDPQADLKPLIEDLIAHEKDAGGATAEGLMCVGRMDAAEATLLRQLGDPDRSESVLDSLQPADVVANPVPEIWDKGWAELRARPAVQAAFAKVGRVLPQAFRPAETGGMQ